MEGGFFVEAEPEPAPRTGPRRFDHPGDRTGGAPGPSAPTWGQGAGSRRFDDPGRAAPAPAWGAHPAAAADPAAGCSKCSSLSYSDEFFKAFGVLVCNQCRKGERLVSKSAAKMQFQITDGDMARLGSVRRANPHRKDWQPMRLYLESQVRAVAHAKHGGEEGVEARARAVLDAKLQGRIRRREEERGRKEREEARLAAIRRRVAEGEAPAPGEAPLDEDEVEEI